MRVRVLVPIVAILALFVGACGGGGDDDDETQSTATTARPSASLTSSPTASPAATPSASPAPANPHGNLLLNSGFEEGFDPWISLNPDSSFQLSQEAAFTGVSSAVLHLEAPLGTAGSRVYYLVQEITPGEFPEVLRGAYRVLNWEKGTPKQYLQVVVIALGADNNPVEAENFQIRYIIAGVSEPPLEIGNAKYLFFSAEEPITGSWLGFETNVKNDFERVWGVVPEGFDTIRVLFEVRYDERIEADGASRADVFYDDLYLGSAE